MRGNHRSSGIERLDGDHGHIRIVVSAPPAKRRKERAFSYLPWPVRLLVKLGLPVLALLAVFVLPNYLDCRSRHDARQFFHGMTVSACTRQTVYGQIDATQKRSRTSPGRSRVAEADASAPDEAGARVRPGTLSGRAPTHKARRARADLRDGACPAGGDCLS